MTRDDYLDAKRAFIFGLMEYLKLPDQSWVYVAINSNILEVTKKYCKTNKQKGLLNVAEGYFLQWPGDDLSSITLPRTPNGKSL